MTKPEPLQQMLDERRARFKAAPTVDNSLAIAGSPMYYRCALCGDPYGVCVPEDWINKPDLCPACSAYRDAHANEAPHD